MLVTYLFEIKFNYYLKNFIEEISPNSMSLSFLKIALWFPKIDEKVANSTYESSNEKMMLIGFDKSPVFLNYFHSFKLVSLILFVTMVFFIIWVIYKVRRKRMNFLLAKVCWFFYLKSLQVILIEIYLFLLINCVYELKSTSSNSFFTSFACLCLLLLISFLLLFPINLMFNFFCVWTPP